MIKMTNELFEKFSTKQEVLDKAIREKFGIENDTWNDDLQRSHIIALRVEVAEFVNECHDIWKYWKQKSIVPDRLLDEAVDVIHFLHLLINKTNISVEYHVNLINAKVDIESLENDKVIDSLDYLLECYSTYDIYALLLLVLDHYGFTLDDIEQAYDKKNKENHTRQANNY